MVTNLQSPEIIVFSNKTSVWLCESEAYGRTDTSTQWALTWSIYRCAVGHGFQPVATFVNYVCTVKIMQSCRQLGSPPIIVHLRLARRSTITVVTLCRERLDTPVVESVVLELAPPLTKGDAVEYLPVSGSCAHHVNRQVRRSQQVVGKFCVWHYCSAGVPIL